MLLATAAVYAHPAIEYEHAATEIELPARHQQVAVTVINDQNQWKKTALSLCLHK